MAPGLWRGSGRPRSRARLNTSNSPQIGPARALRRPWSDFFAFQDFGHGLSDLADHRLNTSVLTHPSGRFKTEWICNPHFGLRPHLLPLGPIRLALRVSDLQFEPRLR